MTVQLGHGPSNYSYSTSPCESVSGILQLREELKNVKELADKDDHYFLPFLRIRDFWVIPAKEEIERVCSDRRMVVRRIYTLLFLQSVGVRKRLRVDEELYQPPPVSMHTHSYSCQSGHIGGVFCPVVQRPF